MLMYTPDSESPKGIDSGFKKFENSKTLPKFENSKTLSRFEIRKHCQNSTVRNHCENSKISKFSELENSKMIVNILKFEITVKIRI